MGGAEVGEDPGKDGMVLPVTFLEGFSFTFLIYLIFHLIGDESIFILVVCLSLCLGISSGGV